MMTLKITEDRRSITDLKRKTNSVLEQIRRTKRPVILTVNGKAEAVLIDAKEYEKITDAFNLLKLIAPAEEDVSDKRYKTARDFFGEFRREKKYEVYLTEHAQEDLEQIYNYIAADSINEASNFVLEIETKINTLESLPHRNPLIPENEFFG